jgi:hypothetical protein
VHPNGTWPGRKYPDSALDSVIGSRSGWRAACIEVRQEAGCESRTNVPAVLDLLRGRLRLLGARLDEDPSLDVPCKMGAALRLGVEFSGRSAARTVNEEARS